MSHKNKRTLQKLETVSFILMEKKEENESADVKMTICNEDQRLGKPHLKGYIWLAAARQSGHVGGQYNKQFF